jgi:hypothetical protein
LPIKFVDEEQCHFDEMILENRVKTNWGFKEPFQNPKRKPQNQLIRSLELKAFEMMIAKQG